MQSFWIVQNFVARWGHGNDVSAVFSAVACLVPRCPKNNHSTRASAQGFAPQIRIHGRDVTEKRTHGHDTSFAFWNLNKNVMKPQESSRSLWCLQPCGLLADCSYTGIYIYIHIYIYIYIYRGREEFCKRQRQMQAHASTMKRGPLGSFGFYFKMLPSLFGISQSIKQQQKRRWDRVGGRNCLQSFWIVQNFVARWGHGNDVSAVFSAVACLVPRCPKNNHSTRASAQGFAPQIRIHGRDVTEKRTHGHDTSFAFWNLNKNVMKPQESSRSLWCLQPCGLLADCSYTGIYIYIHIYIYIYIHIYIYTGAEKNFARDNDKCRHMQVQWRGDR